MAGLAKNILLALRSLFGTILLYIVTVISAYAYQYLRCLPILHNISSVNQFIFQLIPVAAVTIYGLTVAFELKNLILIESKLES